MSESHIRHDPGTDLLQHNEPPAGDELVVAILDAVAEVAGVEPSALDEPLYEAIDTDALAKLFHTLDGSVDGHVAFTYDGYRVLAYSDGTIQVYDEDTD